jgi:hypothetical protein
MKITAILLILFVLSKITFAQINSTSFTSKVDYITGISTSNPVGIIAADLDNDGKNDILVGNQGAASISVFRNTSSLNNISLSTRVDYTTSGTVSFIRTIDLDGDGKLDIILCSATSTGGISVFRNTTTSIGSISFATRQDFICPTGFYDFGMNDVDGDLKPDVVVTNSGSGSFSVFRNTSIIGTISFATRIDQSCGSDPSSVIIFDMDGDGKKDLAITRYAPSQLVLFKNTTISVGSPTFLNISSTPLGSYSHFIKCADLDKDGKLDLVTGNFISNNISIIKNTSVLGTLSVQTPVNITSGSGSSNPQGINLTDFDNDGKIDIAVCNRSNNTISVFKNISSSGILNSLSFASQVTYSVGLSPIDNFASDLNGDGKQDILVSNNGTNTISILRNQILASEPTIAANNLIFSNTTAGSTTLTFTKGNGARRIVLAKVASAVNSNPLDSFAYLAKDTFGLGSQIGAGNFVIYNDTGNTVTVRGLNAGASYYFTVFEYNGADGFSNYLVSPTLSGNVFTGTIYFSKSTGNLNNISTWGTNTDGTGSSPTNFSGNNTYYWVVNGNTTIGGNFAITGTRSWLVVGDGTNAINLNIAASNTITCDSIALKNNATLSVQNTLTSNYVQGEDGSAALYYASTAQNVVTGNYATLTLVSGAKNASGNILVRNTFNLNTNINMGSNILVLGTSVSSLGTLNRTNGFVIGKFSRWFAPTTNTSTTGLFPIGNGINYRPLLLEYTIAPTSGGSIMAEFIATNPGNNGLPQFDNGVFIDKAGIDGYWKLNTGNGITGGTYTASITASNFTSVFDYTELRLLVRTSNSWAVPGTSVANTGTNTIPVLKRTGLTTANVEFGVGGDLNVNPLPVKLISFTANWQENRANLAWQTASEVNNKGFEIERSIDKINFETIGFEKGKGNTNSTILYTFSDNISHLNLASSTVYYRLKQIDFDNKFEYTKIVTLNQEDKKANFIALFPLPMQNELQIQAIGGNETISLVTVYNMNGKEMLQVNNQNNIDVSKLAKGMYTIKVVTDQQTYFEKIVK